MEQHRLLPEQLMRNEKLIPVGKQGRVITVAMSDPMNFLVPVIQGVNFLFKNT